MKIYLDIIQEIVEHGTWKETRTGVSALSISGAMFKHDMRHGFPLLTTKRMSLKNIAVELEFFIKGLRDKRWLQERGCHIWDQWCNPMHAPYGTDGQHKLQMKLETDLGPIYGAQWRNFDGVDQLRNVIETLKKNPLDRRMIVSAWNPGKLTQMALPPCHYAWQVLSNGFWIDLLWNQRSCDYPVGVPYNIAEYALLLLLLAKEANLTPRFLIGFLADVHIYQNQFAQATEQLKREPTALPTVILTHKGSIFDWTYKDFKLENYTPQPAIKYEVNV